MKTIFTLLVTLLVLNATNAIAGNTYTINSNETWTAAGIPNTCNTCTIKINTGFTLTLGGNYTCQSCTFDGGTISMTNQTLVLQSSTNNFSGVTLDVYGTSTVSVSTGLTMTNSTFSFYNGSYFNTQGALTMTSSRVNMDDNSNWLATGSPVNLISTSEIAIGSGSATSKSYVIFNGPVLNVYDNSYVSLGNQNNYWSSWNGYNTYPAFGSATGKKSYSTINNMNCNTGTVNTFTNSCSSGTPSTYGPATMSSGGTTASSILALVLVTFSAENASNNTIDLAWSTQMESNTSHFVIERSADGIVWNEIGETAAKGISSTVSDYAYTDAKPLQGINYYRLQMVNLDGSYGFTDVRVVKTAIINNISFFPNPARDFVNVSLGQSEENEFTLRLYNQSGQLLQEKKVSGGNGTIVTFAIQQYTTGIYIMNVTAADGTRENSKILIAR